MATVTASYLALTPSPAQASEKEPAQVKQTETDESSDNKELQFLPSRLTIFGHAKRPLGVDEKGFLQLSIIKQLGAPTGPIVYLRPGAVLTPWLTVEGLAGFNFGGETPQPHLSAALNPSFGPCWAWGMAEITPRNMANGYYFAQSECGLPNTKGLSLGLEAEGWGEWQNSDTWRHGMGPNLSIQLGSKVTADAGVQTVFGNGNIGLQPTFRVHAAIF